MKKFNKILAMFVATFIIFIYGISLNYTNADNLYVYLGGYTCGFNMKTRGATVIGVADVLTENGAVSPSKCAGLEIGDIILSMNGKEINGAEDLSCILKDYNGGYIVTEILRNNDKRLCDVFPQKDINGNYRIGVFIRDDLCGLGTVTFSNKDGEFASLGHPVTNATGDIIEIKKGEVFDSTIIGVTKAKRGKAGELKGMFIGDNPIGVVNKNTSVGMFGKFYNFNPLNHRKIQVSKGCIGKAQILSTVDSKTVEYFDIEIVKIDYRKGNNKNFVIKITDKDLIEKTGGILQGMSGSPIIQDNKLIGAVTHVFINDSTRGYGISINNMIECLD